MILVQASGTQRKIKKTAGNIFAALGRTAMYKFLSANNAAEATKFVPHTKLQISTKC